MCKEICDRINHSSKATIKKIQMKFNSETIGKQRSISYIRSCLKKMRYSYKRTSIKKPIICSDDYVLRKIYFMECFISKVINDYIVISIDESPVTTHAKSGYFWTSQNERQIFKDKIEKSGYSLILAMTEYGIVNYLLTDKCVESEIYYNFVEETLIKMSSKIEYEGRIKEGKVLMIKDNARFYLHQNVKNSQIFKL